jgi:maleate isomerase
MISEYYDKELLEPNTRNIGLITLSTDPIVEEDFRRVFTRENRFRLYANRVEFNPPVTNENLKAMGPRIGEAASLITPEEPLQIIAYACTSCATNLGDDHVCGVINEGRPDVHAINPALSGREALKALGVKKIGLVTPYFEEVSLSVAGYFEEHGIEVDHNIYMNCEDDYQISRVSPLSLLNASIQASKDVDAVFLSCAALPAMGQIEAIEEKIGIPVVTSNQAMIWHSLRLLGIQDFYPYGKLFEV